MRLGAFFNPTGHHVASWRHEESQADAGINIAHYRELAQTAERAKFDMIFLADNVCVRKAHIDALSRSAQYIANFEPITLLSALSGATSHIGLVATATTSYNEPYHVARKFASLEHISGGRAGWNLVTSGQQEEAQNFGRDAHYGHSERYERAREFAQIVTALWDSWDDDAFIRDKASGQFFNPQGLHTLNHKGKFFSVSGPLNVPRSPQGRPVFVAPGGSPRGRQFAGRNAEIVLAGGETVEDMKGYRDDVLAHATALGRDPAKIKTMFTCVPTVVKSADEVEDTKKMLAAMRAKHLERGLAAMSFLSGIDFSKFDLDTPMPEIKTNGMQTLLRTFKNAGPKATLRDVVTKPNGQGFTHFVGTADQIAGQMQEAMEEIGGDGFLVTGHLKPKYVASIVDELVPALWKRQLTRREYGHAHFRDNLMAF
jgi:FMN-dependent oxidoreductase (nitrilotriacetate monooxygenase family)